MQVRKTEKTGKPRLRWMDDIKLDFRCTGVKRWRQGLWTKENGDLLSGESRPNLKSCNNKEEEKV